ncbi:hypothetical protein PENTCL1PPCAC_13700 [Pristionchus entomophagus]|uniref:Uncharacterized protein n=1 Tax=Pristionchus entomophagus TaxID=358040 RepID=A0AAV5T8U7_9BILA|nr:hypothetical protein PENTCL1PPCAC_13700 [Pristionchus entomophagus]
MFRQLLTLLLLLVAYTLSAKLEDCTWVGSPPYCSGKCPTPQHVIMDMRKKDDMDPAFGHSCLFGQKIKCRI